MRSNNTERHNNIPFFRLNTDNGTREVGLISVTPDILRSFPQGQNLYYQTPLARYISQVFLADVELLAQGYGKAVEILAEDYFRERNEHDFYHNVLVSHSLSHGLEGEDYHSLYFTEIDILNQLLQSPNAKHFCSVMREYLRALTNAIDTDTIHIGSMDFLSTQHFDPQVYKPFLKALRSLSLELNWPLTAQIRPWRTNSPEHRNYLIKLFGRIPLEYEGELVRG